MAGRQDPQCAAERFLFAILITICAAFQRSVAAVYLLSLLTLHTHIQLNLIGRRKYVSAVHEQADAQNGSSNGSVESLLMDKSSSEDGLPNGHSHLPEHVYADNVAERQYLTFTWWYLHRGWHAVCDRIENATQSIIGPWVAFAVHSTMLMCHIIVCP